MTDTPMEREEADVQWAQRLFRSATVQKHTLLVGLVIGARSSNEGTTREDLGTVADKCGLPHATVRAAVDRLTAEGWLRYDGSTHLLQPSEPSDLPAPVVPADRCQWQRSFRRARVSTAAKVVGYLVALRSEYEGTDLLQLNELANELDASLGDVRVALSELTSAGWLAVDRSTTDLILNLPAVPRKTAGKRR